ncbi:MAG: hypothetical protein EHM33_00835 [Chloroflexi bacterium]|nr:MAG: hypothetical protein EHM33_00835 [Chloroflexota bacterium]
MTTTTRYLGTCKKCHRQNTADKRGWGVCKCKQPVYIGNAYPVESADPDPRRGVTYEVIEVLTEKR